MAANSVEIALIVKRHKDSFNRDSYTELLPDDIEQSWNTRYDEKALFYASGFLNSFFWIIFCLPVMEMAWILSRSGTQSLGLNVGICIFALGGALTEWLSHLFWIGVTVASFTLANNFNLDDWLRSDVAANLGLDSEDGIGWRELEADHIVSSGMIWIVDAFEWLCLCGIFCFAFFSVFQWRKTEQTTFGPRWNSLGLFIGLLAMVEFIAEIVRFDGFKVATPIVILYSALNRLILIPAWIISLGFQLPKAASKHFETHVGYYFDSGDDLAMSEQGAQGQSLPRFTIDDDDTDKNVQGLQPPAVSSPPAPTGPAPPPAEAFAANAMITTPTEP